MPGFIDNSASGCRFGHIEINHEIISMVILLALLIEDG